nr:hypothetical protein [Entomoplasma sp. MP1]
MQSSQNNLIYISPHNSKILIYLFTQNNLKELWTQEKPKCFHYYDLLSDYEKTNLEQELDKLLQQVLEKTF